jgi:hypothetical protein
VPTEDVVVLAVFDDPELDELVGVESINDTAVVCVTTCTVSVFVIPELTIFDEGFAVVELLDAAGEFTVGPVVEAGINVLFGATGSSLEITGGPIGGEIGGGIIGVDVIILIF